VLNKVTTIYSTGLPNPNPFENGQNSDSVLLQILVDDGFFTKKPVPQQKDYSFRWSYVDKIWTLGKTVQIINYDLTSAEVLIGTGGYKGMIMNYSGIRNDISIPNSMNGVTLVGIYQDVFSNKNLYSVSFPINSNINRIHARAFKDNNITEIILPESLTRIDFGAFLNNKITKVKIGSGVYLETKVFQNNDTFKAAYTTNGAGTYVFIGGKWIKQ